MYNTIHIDHRKAVKYVLSSFDTRDGSIWKIEFKSVAGGNESEKSFKVTNQE